MEAGAPPTRPPGEREAPGTSGPPQPQDHGTGGVSSEAAGARPPQTANGLDALMMLAFAADVAQISPPATMKSVPSSPRKSEPADMAQLPEEIGARAASAAPMFSNGSTPSAAVEPPPQPHSSPARAPVPERRSSTASLFTNTISERNSHHEVDEHTAAATAAFVSPPVVAVSASPTSVRARSQPPLSTPAIESAGPIRGSFSPIEAIPTSAAPIPAPPLSPTVPAADPSPTLNAPVSEPAVRTRPKRSAAPATTKLSASLALPKPAVARAPVPVGPTVHTLLPSPVVPMTVEGPQLPPGSQTAPGMLPMHMHTHALPPRGVAKQARDRPRGRPPGSRARGTAPPLVPTPAAVAPSDNPTTFADTGSNPGVPGASAVTPDATGKTSSRCTAQLRKMVENGLLATGPHALHIDVNVR
jgi:hypothetical protein